MARKKIKALLDKKKAGVRKWTFEVLKTPEEYRGKIKDENGRVIMEVIENVDYNTLSRLLNTNKYMTNEHDMKGLAEYVWDRGLVPMEDDEKDEWKKKKIVPVEIKEVSL
jgi:hypothetical protein